LNYLQLNCVVTRGVNEEEVADFVALTESKVSLFNFMQSNALTYALNYILQPIDVRFIEYMPFGGNKWSDHKLVSFEEMLKSIRTHYPDIHRLQDSPNDTSKVKTFLEKFL
jgi:cyclic pyranopterin phosphate synthase